MLAVLEQRPPTARTRVDLVRGALDAWMHPPTPSRMPMVAAFVGGGLWTVVATAVLVQPVPPDWPGYLAEVVPLAGLAAGCLLVAAVGCLLRAGDCDDRLHRVAMICTPIAFLAWVVTLGAVSLGLTGGAILAGVQTVAMAVTVVIGLILVRTRDHVIGLLLLVGPVAMLIPATAPWLVFGAAWTAIGVAMYLDRAGTGQIPAGLA